MPNMWQAITCTNVDKDTWGHCSLEFPHIVWYLARRWLKYWLDVAWVPSHYLNQFWLSVNGSLVNSLAPEQNGKHLAEGISNAFSQMGTCELLEQMHWVMNIQPMSIHTRMHEPSIQSSLPSCQNAYIYPIRKCDQKSCWQNHCF